MKQIKLNKRLTALLLLIVGLTSSNTWADTPPQAVTEHLVSSIIGEKPETIYTPCPAGQLCRLPGSDFPIFIVEEGGNGGGSNEYDGLLGSEEINKLKLSLSITPENTELLGERIDLNTGSLSFRHTDVSVPGNNQIEMSVSRIFKGKQWHWGLGNDFAFEDWQLDLPHIHSSLAFTPSGFSGSWGQGKPCSGALEPGLVERFSTIYSSDQFWTGDTLHVPGKTHDKLLDNNSDAHITSAIYGKVTKSNWRISCADRFKNNEKVGEAFIAHSPDGLIYTFEQLKLIATKPSGQLDRYQAYMLVSKVADRFGNEVNYNYDANSNLTSITGNDGRSITLAYNDSNNPYRITSVTTNGRTWTYGYNNVALKSVTLPDNTAWAFNLDTLGVKLPATTADNECSRGTESNFSVSVTHPNGVKGTFDIKDVIHGRTKVPYLINLLLGKKRMNQCFYTLSVKKKTLTGPGLTDLAWNYYYSERDGTWDDETGSQPGAALLYSGSMPSNTNKADTKITSVASPDGSHTVYFYNRDYTSFYEGSLEAMDQFDTDGTLLKRTEYTYAQGNRVGLSGIQDDNVAPQHYQINKTQTKVVSYQTDGNDTYTTSYSDFNSYGVASQQAATNRAATDTRYKKMTFGEASTDYASENNPGFWLLNQPRVNSVSANGSSYTPVSETTYHSATGSYKYLPYEFKRHGQWQSRNSIYYTSGDAQGLVKKVEYNVKMNDNNYRYQQFDSYKRGQVESITLPGQTSAASTVRATKTVDNNGWVTRTVDLNGNGIAYGYDSMGRLTSIDPDDASLANTIISFTKVSGADTSLAGVETNMYKQTITQGNHETVNYLDALHRTVLTKERDKTNSSTIRYIAQHFNAYNNVTFRSFLASSSSTSYGYQFVFDGLQRQTSQKDTTTNATVTTTYKQGNKVSVNDFNSNVTTTTYLAYGQPQQKLATHIASPEGIATSLSYNLFNNITAITQGGVTESRFYDSYQQLCKTVRPDVGDVVFGRDALGQITWQAVGTSTSTTSCDTGNVPLAQKTLLNYNNWGLVSKTDYQNSATADISYGYDKNGNVTTLNNGGISWSYQYNSQNQLAQESLNVAGKSLTVGYTLNSLGHISSITYPTSRVVNLSPNALGESTQASGFASSATYHQNGMLKGYNASNGTVFNQTQTLNQLPDVVSVSKSGTLIYHVNYEYDNNHNITSITDSVNVSQSISNTYDDADRLATSNGVWGNGSFNYNSRGDITSKTLGAKSYSYSYNNGSLTSVSGATSRSFSYNSKGEVTNNGIHSFTRNQAGQITAAAGHAFSYDGHGRRVIDEKNGKKTISFYSQAGVLLYQYDEASQTHSDYIYLAGKQIAKADFAIVGGSALVEKVGYTGHQFDQDLNLNYMQARYYDPVIGRFYSNDPVGFSNVHNFNRYAYANNNPYKYVDPNGMASEPAWTMFDSTFEGIKNFVSFSSGSQKILRNSGATVVPIAIPTRNSNAQIVATLAGLGTGPYALMIAGLASVVDLYQTGSLASLTGVGAGELVNRAGDKVKGKNKVYVWLVAQGASIISGSEMKSSEESRTEDNSNRNRRTKQKPKRKPTRAEEKQRDNWLKH